MVIKTIDVSVIRKCFLAGANALDAKKEMVNDLNVFPVPDGDTGTNMTMTIMSAAREVSALENPDMEQLCKAISSGSLRGARGNSGVILSQLLRGFTKEIRKVEKVDVSVLTKAFERAVESAYKAVMKPKEGTILTVARGGAEKALEMSGQTDNLIELVNSVLMHMNDVLEQTPDMLPVLKQAGVVDSGGKGLLTIMEGAYDALLGKKVSDQIETSAVSSRVSVPAGETPTDVDIKFGYCTEFIIMLEKEFDSKEEKDFKAFLTSIGDSIVCVSDDDVVKVHVHTNDPGLAIQRGLTYGQLTSMKIDNMREEHNEKVIRDAERKAYAEKEEKEAAQRQGSEAKNSTLGSGESDISAQNSVSSDGGRAGAEMASVPQEKKENGFVAVSVGDGLNEIFVDLGVDVVIKGGQTMNPSTEDILDAINSIPADNIFILPNNSNIILTAEQAKDLVKDKKVLVVPTKNIPQGIAAMLNYVVGLEPERNVEVMTEGMEAVKAGQVTYAVRDTTIDGKEIKAGDIMGLSDKTIEAVGDDVVAVTFELIRSMIDSGSELVTIYCGEEGNLEDANQISQDIEKEADVEVEIHDGGQPIYYYFVSVE